MRSRYLSRQTKNEIAQKKPFLPTKLIKKILNQLEVHIYPSLLECISTELLNFRMDNEFISGRTSAPVHIFRWLNASICISCLVYRIYSSLLYKSKLSVVSKQMSIINRNIFHICMVQRTNQHVMTPRF